MRGKPSTRARGQVDRPAATAAAAPDVGEIRASEAADRLGLTKQAVGVWCAKPGAPVRKAGASVFVRWPDFARWREQQLVAETKTAAAAGTPRDRQSAAEARSAEIAAVREEIKLAELQRATVGLADYEAALGRVLDRVVARVRALPPRVGHLGALVEAAVEDEVERLIEELHAFDEDVVDEDAAGDAGDGAPPAGDADTGDADA